MKRAEHARGFSLASILSVCLISAGPALPQVQAASASIGPVGASRILPPSPAYAFPSEKYVYSVQWRFFNAGISTVSIHRSGSEQHVTATAESAGIPDKFFHVQDIFDAQLNPSTFCTLHISKHNEEGSRRRELQIALNYARSKSEVELKDLKTSQVKHDEFDIPPCVTDVVSGFIYVASLPLAPGYTQTFPVNDNGKTTDVKVEVESRDRVKVPTGEYQALRVKATPLTGPMKGKAVLWVWFSDDGRHVPVQMKSKLGFATLLFQLQKIEK